MTRSLVATVFSFVIGLALFSPQVHAHPSWGIAVDPQRQVYFSDLKTIWKIDTRGKLSVFRAADDRHTHDLNIDEAGNLYGADNSYEPATRRFFSALWKMTPAGNFSYLLSPTESPPNGTSIWRDRDGNIYHVTNYPERELLVLKRTPNGNVTALIGSSNAAREYRQTVPYSAGGIAFSSDGALYFVHGANVSKITTSGTSIPLARNLVVENASEHPPGATSLFGIAVDAQGNAFVADYGNRRVLKITQTNQITTVIRAEEPWFPTGVAIGGGELYILEYGHTPTHTPTGTRVRKLSTDGRITILATVTENSASSGNPSAVESPFGETPQRSERKQYISYALIGAGIGLLTLTAIVWRVRRKKSPST
jgi:sugar lactone lactonase YvrE